jgi:integrase
MTWIAAQRRWCKMYRGRRYYISARQLGCPETKEASLLAANEWWRCKQVELDTAYRASLPPPRTPSPAEDIVAALHGDGSSLDWHEQLTAMMTQLSENIQKAFPGSQPPRPVDPEAIAYSAEAWRRTALKELIGKLIDGEPIPPELTERLAPARKHQIEFAIKGLRGESAAQPDRTVQALADDWLHSQQTLVMIKSLTATSLAHDRICLGHFTAYLGETADVGTIDCERLEGFHNHCLSKIAEQHWSASYAKEVFKTARIWIKWLWERGAIEAPKNLNRRFKFGSTVKQIQTWTVDEVRQVIGQATGKLRIALLLMLNCGFTQRDVSDLADAEVNWRDGRIIRKRSKTRGQANVPTVDYTLWPSTLALLQEHRSGGERVLVTKSGKPYVSAEMIDGKVIRSDNFCALFHVFRKRLGFRKSLKLLRKTSASLLESHPIYGRLTSLFLGHSPASIKDRHYAAVPQALFDEAVVWLGGQLGVAELPPAEG